MELPEARANRYPVARMYSKELWEALDKKLREARSNPTDAWLTELAHLLYSFPLDTEKQPVQTGEDGFPYFNLWLPGETPKPVVAKIEDILDYAIKYRIGFALHTGKGFRMWEIPHGGVLAWRLYGTPKPPRFWDAPPDTDKHIVWDAPEVAWMGTPNEQMLPLWFAMQFVGR